MNRAVKLLLAAVVMLSAIETTAAIRKPISLIRSGLTWRGKIEWDKKIIDGADSLFNQSALNPTDTMTVNGTIRDSVYSCIYDGRDHNSVSFNIFGGTTTRLQIEIQTANLGNYNRLWTSPSGFASIPDSVFKTHSWIVTGTGVNGDKVSVSQDSIQSNKRTIPIELFLIGQQQFRFLVICSVDQVGNTRVSADIWQKEE